jgi:protein SCO1
MKKAIPRTNCDEYVFIRVSSVFHPWLIIHWNEPSGDTRSPVRFKAFEGGWLAAASLAAILMATANSPAFGQPSATQLVQDVGLDQHLDEQLPLDLEFRDEEGNIVRLGEFFGERPVILNLVYFRCPMLCTEVLNGLLKSSQAMQLRMGDDYQVISVSIDPRETPAMAAAKKQRYVEKYRRAGAAEGWHFLTGDQASIDELTRAVGFRYRYDPKSDQYAHASGLVVLTPEGRLSRYFYGIDYPPGDLRLGLVESSQHRIGNRVDQFLLLCFHYDPATGRYGLAISRVLQLAGAATLLGLGSYLCAMYRLERRRSQAARFAAAETR